jgi:hypothetical protein
LLAEQRLEPIDVARLGERLGLSLGVARETKRLRCLDRVVYRQELDPSGAKLTTARLRQCRPTELRDHERRTFAPGFCAYRMRLGSGRHGLRIVAHAHADVGLGITTKEHHAGGLFGSARKSVELDRLGEVAAKLGATRKKRLAATSPNPTTEAIEDAHEARFTR